MGETLLLLEWSPIVCWGSVFAPAHLSLTRCMDCNLIIMTMMMKMIMIVIILIIIRIIEYIIECITTNREALFFSWWWWPLCRLGFNSQLGTFRGHSPLILQHQTTSHPPLKKPGSIHYKLFISFILYSRNVQMRKMAFGIPLRLDRFSMSYW